MSHSVVEDSVTKPLDIFVSFPLWDLEYYKNPDIMVQHGSTFYSPFIPVFINFLFPFPFTDEHG